MWWVTSTILSTPSILKFANTLFQTDDSCDSMALHLQVDPQSYSCKHAHNSPETVGTCDMRTSFFCNGSLTLTNLFVLKNQEQRPWIIVSSCSCLSFSTKWYYCHSMPFLWIRLLFVPWRMRFRSIVAEWSRALSRDKSGGIESFSWEKCSASLMLLADDRL